MRRWQRTYRWVIFHPLPNHPSVWKVKFHPIPIHMVLIISHQPRSLASSKVGSTNSIHLGRKYSVQIIDWTEQPPENIWSEFRPVWSKSAFQFWIRWSKGFQNFQFWPNSMQTLLLSLLMKMISLREKIRLKIFFFLFLVSCNTAPPSKKKKETSLQIHYKYNSYHHNLSY